MDDRRNLADSLMSRAAGGDRDAFGQLTELVGLAVYRFCLAHLPPPMRDVADDARQECFLRAWKNRRRFRSGGNAVGWLMGIAINVVRERRRKFRPALSLDDFDPPEKVIAGPDERLKALTEAVEILPPRQREAVACRFLRGMSVAETAAVMGCAEGTVKAAVFKAIANLQEMMKRPE
ncbi:MAG: sigma-70 family RNA polymerase sigma factor [Phycisphaerae bacterium]|nr:sigma-70 family RNA polymerase sigma factor [Phycisphaerae bacterium]